jgi:hypothetical protein
MNAISMNCNWCPDCQDTATDYYHEWVTFKPKPRGTKSSIEQLRIDFRFHGEENNK